MSPSNNHAAEAAEAVLGYLGSAHLLRGGLYLAAGAAVMQGLSTHLSPGAPDRLERVHLAVLPLTLAITAAFAQLRPEDRARLTRLDLGRGLAQAGQGAALGATAMAAVLGVAAARGWLDAPAWGWEALPAQQVAGSLGRSALVHLAVALNEEIVFRGYGYETLRLALPDPTAAALLTLLFGLAHPLRPLTLAGELALGLALHRLRARSGALWASIGYHWAWNLMQSGIFGPADGRPSLRPLRVHGPYRWLGRPGHPEPGLLALLANLLVALAAGLRAR